MLIHKNKIAFMSSIIIAFAAFMVFAEETPVIDVSQLRQANPFAQFAGAGSPTPAAKPLPEGPKPDLFIETVSLKFVDAKSLKASIATMSSEWGNMEPDAKGNSLIICDTNDNIRKIIEQIHKIDRKPEQIMIEVVILDVKLDNETEIGVNWDMLKTDNFGDGDASFRQNYTSRVGVSTTLVDGVYNSGTGIGSDFSFYFGNIRNVIHVLQTKNNVEIIASPRIIVVSGEKASIAAVEQIPYKESSDTSGGGSLTSTQFKDVGVTLKITATLTDDKYIFLNVETEQSVQTGTSIVTGGVDATGVPIVDKRNIQSALLLNDGQILAIGGLRRKETQKQTTQIPFLGDIPWVGEAFKSTDTIQNNSELLVLLSPHIYNGEKPSDVEMAKYNEITKRPLVEIPENERQKDKKKVDKKSKETKKVKSKTKAKK
ncbi:MAG: secretin N-terminal domain-containing protein [Phycisphaerae bacterium]|jgi:type II secretory pathway component GspD/PulD (secretin)